MDKVKEFLRLAIRYRFWIVVAVAALLPMIAYFVGSGAVRAETETQTTAVNSAATEVKKYTAGLIPSNQFKVLADQRTEVVAADVDKAWRLLYERQSPLLTWPEEVADMFETWGKQWPANYDDVRIREVISDYIQVYPDQVDETYDAFRPFDYKEGSGIVVAPIKEMLLRPAQFSLESPPTLGEVWGAQQKLWIQRTVLDVIDQVNSEADDWDEAPIKEITGLEVASELARDQKSVVKEEVLEPAPEIVKPGTENQASSAATTTATSSSAQERGAMVMAGRSSSGGFNSGGAPEPVYIFKKASPDQPFEVIPVYASVLIDQRRVLDLIAAFENSPMEIQVVDFEWSRPTKSVQKPEKGEENPMFSYGMMGSGIAGGMMSSGVYRGSGMPGAMSGYGDMESMINMRSSGAMRGYGGYGGYGTAPAKKSGTDISADQIKKLEERKKKAEEEGDDEKNGATKGSPYTDPYFDIVEVKIYGHARFYNPPPPEAPATDDGTSPGDDSVAAADADPAADGETPAAKATPTAPPAEATPNDTAPQTPAPAAADANPSPEAPPADATSEAAGTDANADAKADADAAPPAPTSPPVDDETPQS